LSVLRAIGDGSNIVGGGSEVRFPRDKQALARADGNLVRTALAGELRRCISWWEIE